MVLLMKGGQQNGNNQGGADLYSGAIIRMDTCCILYWWSDWIIAYSSIDVRIPNNN